MIYFLQKLGGSSIKIGTTTNLTRRLKQYSRANDGDWNVLGVMDGGQPEERAVHKQFVHLRIGDTPISERFHAADELMDFIYAHVRDWTEADDSPSQATPNSLVIRGSVEWREWLKRAADHDRSQSVADFIDRAVASYARQIAFAEVPPKR